MFHNQKSFKQNNVVKALKKTGRITRISWNIFSISVMAAAAGIALHKETQKLGQELTTW